MASTVYPSFKQKCLEGNSTYNLTTATVKASLVSSAYTPSTAHEFWDDVSANEVGTAVTIDNKSVTNGVFDTSDDSDTWASVAGGSTVDYVVIWIDTGGAASTDPLICWIELPSSITTNGGDITVDWDDGTTINGFFAL